MKNICVLLAAFLLLATCGCAADTPQCDILATTRPVYDLASALCDGTGLSVSLLISENVSCLHDYSLSTAQMKAVENAQIVLLSGAGLEDFQENLFASRNCVDASLGIELIECHDEHAHEHGHTHEHEEDPHIWLSPVNAKHMAQNICDGLCVQFPEHADLFAQNLRALSARLDELQSYGEQTLSALSCRELITFHDGFAYLAQAFDLTILAAVEEESGSEASAKMLIELIEQVREHDLPAVFAETNGSPSACGVISRETGAQVYVLDMCMGEGNYFENMYRNIDTLKEALG